MGRTELQAAKKIYTSKGDPPRDSFIATTLPGRDHLQNLASGRNLCISSKPSQDRGLEKSSSTSQHELTAMLASATASPSRIKETTTTCYKDIVEHIFHGEKRGIPPICTERSHVSESERSQVISPPLAEAIRDYVNTLLIQGGVRSLPGSTSVPPLDLENTHKRINLSSFQETESLSPPQKFPRLSEKSVEEQGSGSLVPLPDKSRSELMSPLAKTVVSHSLSTLGIERSEQPQHARVDEPELSFPFHESIFKVIEEEWQQIDRQPPSLACKYPVSSTEAPRILSVPKVDDEILGLMSETAPSASIQAASTVSSACDQQLDIALGRVYEAAAASLQVATHTAFVARAMQADISQAVQILSSDPSQAQEILRKTYDAASYLCDAAFDEVKLAAHTMGSSTLGRRHLWLKDCKINPASKNKLTVSPFKGGNLFGGEVSKVVKKRGKKY